jgi:hypothetical protein
MTKTKITLKPGDIFKIKTLKGHGYLQYIETTDLGSQLVRVLDFVNSDITQEEVDRPERWNIEFPLKAAVTRKLVAKVGHFEIPDHYKISEFARVVHTIRGEFKGWFIVNRNTLQRELKTKLTGDELKLSPFGVMNDTLIAEYLDNDWRLENWK